MINKELQAIRALGYDVKIASNKNGIARAYLVEGDKKISMKDAETGDVVNYVEFRDNKEPSSAIQERIVCAGSWSHAGRAISEIARLVVKK